MNDIPIIDTEDEDWETQLDFELNTTGGSSDYRNDRERPYNGQPQTDEGTRGKTLVEGLTFRDIRDCFVTALLTCCGCDQPELSKKVEDGTWRTMDIYKIDLSQLDPLAVAQNMSCNMEKMMGIYPNRPPLDVEKFFEEIKNE